MDIVWYCICAATLTAFLAMNARKALHMFQLNSYKPATHMRWLKRNLACLIPGLVDKVSGLLNRKKDDDRVNEAKAQVEDGLNAQ